MSPRQIRLLVLLGSLLLAGLLNAGCARSAREPQVFALTPTATTRPLPTPPQPSAAPVTAGPTPRLSTPAPPPTATPAGPTLAATETPAPLPTDSPPPATPAAEAPPKPAALTPYQVARLLVGPGQPGRLYAWQTRYGAFGAVQGRLLTSDDLGASWQPFAGGAVRPVGLDYASGALYGATDAGLARWDGVAWQAIAATQIDKLLVSLDDPGEMWAQTQAQMGRSTDGGLTWRMEPANGVPLDPFLVPGQPGYIFLAGHVWGQHFLSRSTGNGQWDLLPKPDHPGEPIGTWRDIRGAAVDGGTGAVYLMLANQIGAFNPLGSQLWRSHNLNAADRTQVAWTLLGDYGPTTQMQLLAAGWNPQGGGPALYANIRPEYCPPKGGVCDPEPAWALYRSLDQGVSWQAVAMPAE